MRSALYAVVLLFALLASGCSAEDFRTLAIRPATDVEHRVAGNRILVQGVDGNIFTIDASGSDRINLTQDAGLERQYLQPTWSPDASQVAVSRADGVGGLAGGAAVILAHDGALIGEASVRFPPFYIAWSPIGDHFAYLSNWQGMDGPTMALRLVDVASSTVDTVAEGWPYYFAWAPEGSRILAHIGSNRLEIQDVSGKRQALLQTAANFAAPQWSSQGDQLVFATSDEGRQEMVIATPSGEPLTIVTPFDGKASFALSPEGDQLAYVLSSASSSVNTLGPLYVADVETLRTRELTDDPVWAFFWSPDGEKLAYITSQLSGGDPRMRWNVWDGAARTQYPPFFPTRTFFERYLIFSDQYARSMSVWSPGSDALTYAALGRENQPSIWVQHLGEEWPRRVARGEFSAWSPR